MIRYTLFIILLHNSYIIVLNDYNPSEFSKKRGFDRTSVFRGGDLFQGGFSFYIKNKLKSDIFNDEKSL